MCGFRRLKNYQKLKTANASLLIILDCVDRLFIWPLRLSINGKIATNAQRYLECEIGYKTVS